MDLQAKAMEGVEVLVGMSGVLRLFDFDGIDPVLLDDQEVDFLLVDIPVVVEACLLSCVRIALHDLGHNVGF